MADKVSDYAKQVYENLELGRYNDLAIVSTRLSSLDGYVDCDVVVVVHKMPTDDAPGEFQPLLMIVDKRNIEYIEPIEAVQEPSSAPPDPPPGLVDQDDAEPPHGSSEAAGDGPAPA